jgi:hypothetical protein
VFDYSPVSTIAKLEPGSAGILPALPAWTKEAGRQDPCTPTSGFAYDLNHGIRGTLCSRESARR